MYLKKFSKISVFYKRIWVVEVVLLKAEDVVSGYGEIEILHGVSMSIKKSQIVAILGPNGAGKSTFLKTIFGFLKPKRGRIIYEGKNITGLPPETILTKGISYVSQTRSVFKYLTVLENLRLGGYVLNKAEFKEAVENVYRIFPILRERKNQIASSLSGGEQRILEIARALMLRPRLILLDEPSANLAPILVNMVYKKVEELRDEEKIAFGIVEQNVVKALDVADYAYVLELGQVALEGTKKEVLDMPKMRALYLAA